MMFSRDKNWLELSFKNIERPNVEERYIEAILDPLLSTVPGRAKFFLEIEEQGDGLHGHLEIRAFRENYVGHCRGSNVYSLVESLRKMMIMKIHPQSDHFLSELSIS